MNYMLIIIECEISLLLFECCPYVGNVQITRISYWCELTLSCVVLGLLWYVTGWEYLLCFPLLRIVLWTMLLNLFGLRFSLKVVLCWGRSAKIVEQVVDFELNFLLRYKWIFDRVVLINSNFTLFIFSKKCDILFYVEYSDYLYYLHCWENEVLQKVGIFIGTKNIFNLLFISVKYCINLLFIGLSIFGSC